MTLRLAPDTDGITAAATLLQDGALVAFATETVYGLGADATNAQAVAGIYDAKGRPSFNPLIVHVPDLETARQYVRWSDDADRLAGAFWPGALTLVLPLKPGHGIASLVTAGLNTLAIRVPAHDTALALLRKANRPIAAPSANPSGRISSTSYAHVMAGLDGKIAAVLDDGACSVGVESTILGLAGTPTLLRPGGVAQEQIETVLGEPLGTAKAGQITAPGQLVSHYAPKSAVRLNATAKTQDEILLGFGEVSGDLSLSPNGNLREAAANLFDMLHRLDEDGRAIAVAPIPNTDLGKAINDRLQRAAAPRDT